MRHLPDNPHLDHLRQQAKDLRAGRPGATLAEAQAALAELYGFRSWAELKAEVARHGPADVADRGLAERIRAVFGLGTVTGSMRSAARPDEVGRRWVLQTDRGQWTAQTVDDVYPVTDGEENARFQEAAARAGVVLPLPVRSTSGRVTEEIGGHRWRVFTWVRSGPPLVAPASADVTRTLGRLLGSLHALRFPAERLCPWSSTRLGAGGWAELAGEVAAKGADWAPLLRDALPTLDGLALGGTAGEPVMCHNNLNPANVRAGARDTLVVTGWEHAAGLPPAWELCAALVSWAVHPGGEVSVAAVRALLDGYGERPELTLESFRGTATAMQNYVYGQVELALATGEDRAVRHLLTHLPSRATYERILAAIPPS